MKLSSISKSLLLVLALVLATGAFAANKQNKGSLTTSEPLTVSGHQLKPGEYQLKWDGANTSVELSILSQGKLVATVPARLVQLDRAARDNAIESQKSDDGSQSLTQIDFAGKKYVLAFDTGSATAESMSQERNH